eukprot:364843-Chlamydomonas_euryale.AAC.12
MAHGGASATWMCLHARAGGRGRGAASRFRETGSEPAMHCVRAVRCARSSARAARLSGVRVWDASASLRPRTSTSPPPPHVRPPFGTEHCRHPHPARCRLLHSERARDAAGIGELPPTGVRRVAATRGGGGEVGMAGIIGWNEGPQRNLVPLQRCRRSNCPQSARCARPAARARYRW